jgi:hypothetical protein
MNPSDKVESTEEATCLIEALHLPLMSMRGLPQLLNTNSLILFIRIVITEELSMKYAV